MGTAPAWWKRLAGVALLEPFAAGLVTSGGGLAALVGVELHAGLALSALVLGAASAAGLAPTGRTLAQLVRRDRPLPMRADGRAVWFSGKLERQPSSAARTSRAAFTPERTAPSM